MSFVPVILGTDINAYGVARSLHEAYGIKSYAIGRKPLRYTRKSKILHVETYGDFYTDQGFLRVMEDFAQTHKKEGTLLLISCSDEYTSLITKYKDRLAKDYVFNYIDHALQERLENKLDFYEICEDYGLDYPKTQIISLDNYQNFNWPSHYPLGLKANDSIEYVHLDFDGKKKFYKIHSQEDLEETVQLIYGAGYQGELILQDYIPGDSSAMFVLNAYVDSQGEVTMMCLGKCLLDECLPTEIGNYNALLTLGDQAIYDQYESFLKRIGYRGFANFDLKYDERDGKYKVFEINIRQGRSSYYMTAGGCNFMTYYVADLIENKRLKTHYHFDQGLWLYVDPAVLRKYVNPKDKDLALTHLRRGYSFTQWYEKDQSLARFMDYWRRRLSTRKYYPIYQEKRQEEDQA
ncbi:MAG: carboxylate--amine ligase [Tissierellia bacterium]|nr:carboxylate--amine ligase [Tissierellia bacterium]